MYIHVKQAILQILQLRRSQRDLKIADLAQRHRKDRRSANARSRRTVDMRIGLCAGKTQKRQRNTSSFFVRTEKQRRSARGSGVVGWSFLCPSQRRHKQRTRFRLDLVNRAIRKRDDKHISVWSGLNI